ncbi:uncharacterized protein HaLaN_19010, partial [Haematococcus lacustris]
MGYRSIAWVLSGVSLCEKTEGAQMKRQIKAPKRFDDDEVIWDVELPTREMNSVSGQKRPIYRVLRDRDIRSSLITQKVFLFWPEDKQWYRGVIHEVDAKQCKLYVYYPEEDQYEEIDARELIKENHIAVMEEKAASAPLRKGREIPVNEAERLTAVYEEMPSSSEDEGGVLEHAANLNVDLDGETAGFIAGLLADDPEPEPESEQARQQRAERVQAAAARSPGGADGLALLRGPHEPGCTGSLITVSPPGSCSLGALSAHQTTVTPAPWLQATSPFPHAPERHPSPMHLWPAVSQPGGSPGQLLSQPEGPEGRATKRQCVAAAGGGVWHWGGLWEGGQGRIGSGGCVSACTLLTWVPKKGVGGPDLPPEPLALRPSIERHAGNQRYPAHPSCLLCTAGQ